MLELQKITIDDKEMFDRFLKRKCSRHSEFTFTNLFMWRKSYDICYLILDDMLCIMPQHKGSARSATFPIGFMTEDGGEYDIRPVIETLIRQAEEEKREFLLRLYDNKTVDRLVTAFPGRFFITEDVNYFDYVYRVADLVQLSGKRYHAKKNFVNRFQKSYDWEYQRLSAENAGECLELFARWSQKEDGDAESIAEEAEAVQELFENWDALGVRGGCLRVDGAMVAFSVGEPLCEDTVVIHLEHADTDYVGAFAMMNQQFLAHEWQDYTYVNREEDMGIPGLRKAKESYRPAFMVKKYVATLMP